MAEVNSEIHALGRIQTIKYGVEIMAFRNCNLQASSKSAEVFIKCVVRVCLSS